MGRKRKKKRRASPRQRNVTQPIEGKRFAPSENNRPVTGIHVSPNHVHTALLDAGSGYMAPLADLIDETIMYEPTASAGLAKRFATAALLARELVVTPAEGPGVDPDLAKEAAAMVGENLRRLDTVGATAHLAWGLHHGRAGLEWHYTRRGGHTYPHDFGKIFPRRLSFGPERELRIVDTWHAVADFVPQGFALRDAPGQLMGWTPSLFGVHPEVEGLGPRLLYWALFKRFNWRWRMQLTELFARGWRVLRRPHPANPMDVEMPDADEIEQARNETEALGRTNTVNLPAGMELDLKFPDAVNFQAFTMTSGEVDKQIQRLINWNTGTDGDEGNRANGVIAQAQQDLATMYDSYGLSRVWERQLALPMCELEYGAERAERICPLVRIKAERERDVAKDLSNAQSLTALGGRVSLAQLHERSGWREPEADEPYVIASAGAVKVVNPAKPVADNDVVDVDRVHEQLQQHRERGQEGASERSEDGPPQGVARAPAADPPQRGPAAEGSKKSGEDDHGLAPTTVGGALTANEIREKLGKGPALRSDGSLDPDGNLPYEIYKIKKKAEIEAEMRARLDAASQLAADSSAALLMACGVTVTADVRAALMAYAPPERARFVAAIQRHAAR